MGEVARQPDISRNALAAKVCGWTDWHNAFGKPQLASARKALGLLDRCGAIRLPAIHPDSDPGRGTIDRDRRSTTPAPPSAPPVMLAQVHGGLAELGGVELVVVDSSEHRAVYSQLMQHHPLGDQRLCGAQMRLLFRSSQGWLGACAFQSSSFTLQARDRWIGWSENVRRGNLARVVCNARFLILPSVRVPHLASHLLGRLARELPAQWQARYGVRPLLLETYVHPNHVGTCYKAAGWRSVGHSAGRRDGVAKAVWVRELEADARQALRSGPALLPREAPDNPSDWAQIEFGALEIWDARLRCRAFELAEDFYAHAQARCVTRRYAERARMVAAHRFFRNPKISMRTLLEAHRIAVIERMRAHPVVLVPQDTTLLNYSVHRGSEGLGPIGTKLDLGPVGLMLHNSHAFTPQGVPLGVVSAEYWARAPEEQEQRRPPDERESHKWLDAYKLLRDMAPRVPETCLVSIGDREADLTDLSELFEIFALAREPKSPRLLVRACQGRRGQVDIAAGRLPPWRHMQALPAAGHMSVDIPQRGEQRARTAQLALRFGAVNIDPPAGVPDVPIQLWAVHLDEEDPPEGARAVQWMLLTNMATTSLDEARERARWYAARWWIEEFHRTLKTGCQLEERQLGYAVRLENCLAIDMVVAWRIHYLTMLGRMDREAPGKALHGDPVAEGAV